MQVVLSRTVVGELLSCQCVLSQRFSGRLSQVISVKPRGGMSLLVI